MSSQQSIHMTQLLENLKSHKSVVGIIGLGYVGLPLLLRFAEAGFNVLGFDIDEKKVQNLNSGQSYIAHISSKCIADAQKKFVATSDFRRAREADVLIICVPTPLNKYREPDLS